EDDAVHPEGAGALGDRLANLLRLGRLVAVLHPQIRHGRKGSCGLIVHQLGVDVPVGSVHGEAGARRRPRHLAADPAVPADPGLALRFGSHHAAPFAALPAFLRTYSPSYRTP